MINPEWFIGLSTGRFSQSTIEKRAVRTITSPSAKLQQQRDAFRNGGGGVKARRQGERNQTQRDTSGKNNKKKGLKTPLETEHDIDSSFEHNLRLT